MKSCNLRLLNEELRCHISLIDKLAHPFWFSYHHVICCRNIYLSYKLLQVVLLCWVVAVTCCVTIYECCCRVLRAACVLCACVLRAACCVLRVACCVLRVAGCVLRAACCVVSQFVGCNEMQ